VLIVAEVMFVSGAPLRCWSPYGERGQRFASIPLGSHRNHVATHDNQPAAQDLRRRLESGKNIGAYSSTVWICFPVLQQRYSSCFRFAHSRLDALSRRRTVHTETGFVLFRRNITLAL